MSNILLILYGRKVNKKDFVNKKIGGVITACNRIIKMHKEIQINFETYKYCDFGDKLNFLYPLRILFDLYFMVLKTNKVKYSYCVCDHSSIIRSIIYLLISKIIFTDKRYFLDIRGGGKNVRLEDQVNSYRSLLLSIAYRLADKIILQTPEKTSVPKNLAHKVFFLPNTIIEVNKKVIKNKKNIFNEENKFKIIFAGRITEEKGIEKIFKLCNSNISSKIKIGLAGPIKLNKENKMIFKKHCEKNNIIYHGVLDKSSLLNVLSEYNLFLFTSDHLTEGMPNSLLDAVSVKLPILTKDIGFIKELFKEDHFNFLAESNISFISKYIDKIINNYSFYLSKAGKAFDFAQTNYTEKVYKSKLIKLYN